MLIVSCVEKCKKHSKFIVWLRIQLEGTVHHVTCYEAKKNYKFMMSNSLVKSKFANCYFIRSAIKTNT